MNHITVIDVQGHPDLRCYHSRDELIQVERQEARRYQQLTDDVAPIIKKLVMLPGVAVVSVEPYSAMIQKAHQFDWCELDGPIREALGAEKASKPN